jgi:hypothetical protein
MYMTQTQQLTSSATFTLSQKRNLVENNTSTRLDPIAARLPPDCRHTKFVSFFFDTIQRLQWVLAHVYDSNTLTYVQCYLYIESRKEFGGK